MFTFVRARVPRGLWLGALGSFGFAKAAPAAQITGAVRGTVRDASGAVLPGAAVTVSGPSLQREDATAVTSELGTYRAPLLPAGEYTVRAELSGFSTVTHIFVANGSVSLPRNDFRTDAFVNVDLRAEKRFRVGDGHAIGLLVEAFSLTNQANTLNVNSVSGPDFGPPVSFFPGREVQVGLRYLFGR